MYKFAGNRIRYCVYFIAITMLIALPGRAQEELNAHPAMWLVERGNAKVYFLGSVHLLPDDVKWYGGQIKDAVESADEVAFEVHMTDEKQAQAQQITFQHGMMENGDLLSNYLEPEEYSTLVESARSFGIPEATIAGFKPWSASIVLSISAIRKEGWNAQSGVDKYIEKIAVQRDLKISELETLEFQLSTLYDHPMDVQVEMLKETIEQLGDIRSVTLEMVNAWAEGDEEKMLEAFLIPMRKHEEIYEKLVVTRNNNWISVIEGLIEKEQTTMVVAGVAHFIGSDGVVELLKENGYSVKRIQ